MIFARLIEPRIESRLFQGKAIVVYGPRRVGKTTLVKRLEQKYPDKSIYVNCDEPDVRRNLTDRTSTELLNFFAGRKLVIIDEAQRVKNIGLTLKLLVDNAPKIQVVATGSSSLDLSNKIVEPLTGRTFEFLLTPLSLKEIGLDRVETARLLETRILYGSYPEIVTHPEQAQETIRSIYRNYLYKDALEFQGLRNPELIEKLLQALALQIGNEVHFTELAKLLEVDKQTVASYIRLLELAFVIFRLPPLARNLRKEISKSRKIYFWDTGIRNAIINNFNPLSLRSDVGPLWENLLIAERFKRNQGLGLSPNTFFWRSWSKQEIDYLEEEGGKFSAFEIKWQRGKRSAPKAWARAYPGSSWQTVTRENFYGFIV